MTSPQGPTASPLPELVIAGGSTRAAAFSALRAGFRPYCFDHFGDADLRAVTEVHAVANYPQGLIAAVEARPDVPLMYVGALENAGNVLDFLEMGRPFLGNPRDVVRNVRDPELVAQTFEEFSLPRLEVRSMHDVPPRDGAWLVKPLAGSGGRGIVPWTDGTTTPDEPHYFQQRTTGPSYSAVFVAPADQRDVRFVGITRQIIGDARLGASPFAWCGSVGPETLTVANEQVVRRIGNILSWRLGLAGLFGFDFVVDAGGVPRLTEVNPRYTGSVEVLEHTLHLALLRDHCAVFGVDPPALATLPPGVTALGKFILYSTEEWRAPDPADWLLPDEWIHADMWQFAPRVADIPTAGTLVRAGQPICTLYVTGESPSECVEGLPEYLNAVKTRLGHSTGEHGGM